MNVPLSSSSVTKYFNTDRNKKKKIAGTKSAEILKLKIRSRERKKKKKHQKQFSCRKGDEDQLIMVNLEALLCGERDLSEVKVQERLSLSCAARFFFFFFFLMFVKLH